MGLCGFSSKTLKGFLANMDTPDWMRKLAEGSPAHTAKLTPGAFILRAKDTSSREGLLAFQLVANEALRLAVRDRLVVKVEHYSSMYDGPSGERLLDLLHIEF
jgi:hypothetical protein